MNTVQPESESKLFSGLDENKIQHNCSIILKYTFKNLIISSKKTMFRFGLSIWFMFKRENRF